ncbi:hypothetical protein LCGC14_2432970, partial [marine sediment metagenome]
MAQTRSNNLEGVQYKTAVTSDWVIKLTDGSTTWYVSQTVKHLG